MLAIFLVSLFAVSAVGAADNNVTNISNFDNENLEVIDVKMSDEISSSNSHNIDSDNYNTYFNNEGVLKSNVVSDNDTINIVDNFSEKKFIFNKPINVVGFSSNNFKNCIFTFNAEASGSNISNLNIFNTKDNNIGIFLNGASNCLINNCFINNTGKESFAICVANGANNNSITNNKLTAYGKTYGHGTRSTTPLLISGSDYNFISNNIINCDDANGIYLSRFEYQYIDVGLSNYNIIYNNTVKYNILPTSWSYGIYAMGKYNTIDSNKVIGAYRGIVTSDNGNIIINNYIVNITGLDYADLTKEIGTDCVIYAQVDSIIINNTIENAKISSKGYGINADKGSIIENNSIHLINSANGIKIKSNSIIKDNTFIVPSSSKNVIVFDNDATNITEESNNVIIIKNSNVVVKEEIYIFSGENAKYEMTTNVDGKIQVSVGSFVKIVNTVNCTAIIEIPNVDMAFNGLNVEFLFTPYSKYYSYSRNYSTIHIYKTKSNLLINDSNGTVDHELQLTAHINSNNETINEGVVTFFDGKKNIGNVNVFGGVATLTYTPTTAGEHTITAIFNSNNYENSNDTAFLTVAKADVDLNIGYIDDVYYTNPSNFAVNINSNSKPVNEGKIKYYVNDQFVGTVDVYEGTANFDYVTDATGSFTLTATYEETDNYFAKNASAKFTVNKMPTTLSGESVIFDEESYKTFTTQLRDDNNNCVGGQLVKIEVIKYSGESATFNGISDANGITVYDVGRLAGGMWYVTGVFAGNDNYISSRFVDRFIVVRMNTTTEVGEIDNPKVNHNCKLKANILDENGKLVKEGIVQFYLDGADIGSIDLSNYLGHQSSSRDDVLGAVNPMFEYVLGADDVSDLYINYIPTKAGKHTLTAVYEGTTIYKASNSTTSFDVADSNTVETTVTASGVTTVYNGGKYIVVTLKDVNGKAISGVKVSVVLNGKTYAPTTNSKGQVKVSTNGLAPVKTYTAKITFNGNSKYDKATKSVKVSVKKATPKLTAKAKTFKKSVKTKNFVVTLKTNQNKVMKNTKVTLKVNGKAYSAKTNTKGQATFKITKLTKKGKFTATIKYAGSKYYNAKTVKAKITVK